MGSKIGVLKIAAKRLNLTFEEYLKHIEDGEKHCTVCKQWKDISSFNLAKNRGDGHEPTCKECRRVKEPKPRFMPTRKGAHHTIESRLKMSESQKGNKNRLGKPWTDTDKTSLSMIVRKRVLRGPRHPRWKGGISPVTQVLRHSFEYKAWRLAVYRRDKFTCQICGSKKGGELVAHHIKFWSTHPELRFELSNGITLCNDCHLLQHPDKKTKNLLIKVKPQV